MFRVFRPEPNVLVVSKSRTQALIRLGIWVVVVSIFYVVVLGGGFFGAAGENTGQRGLHESLLLLFPLFLLPYVFSCVKEIGGGGVLTFDGASRTVLRKDRPLAPFDDIRELHLRAVNATCEEFCLGASLADGRFVTLLENEPSATMDTVALEIADLIGVELNRST